MKPARTLLAAFAAFLLPFTTAGVASAEGTDSEKIDTILVLQKEVIRTIKNDPLRDKNFGIEFNFLRFILLTEQTSISGGFSIFSLDRNAEIAFPFLYSTSKTEELGESWADSLPEIDFTEFTLDVHYRYFLGNTQNGFYLSGFARTAYLTGVKGQTVFDGIGGEEINSENARATEGKLGVGMGIGWRKFSYKGLYWGTSLNLGRYMIGKNDYFRNGFLSIDADNELIFDVELFKFGWAF